MITKFKIFEKFDIDPYGEEVWDDDSYFIGMVLVNDDKIEKDDYILDLEKKSVIINNEIMGIVKCVEVLDDYDLVWESLDGKSSACDSISQFKKVLNYRN